MKLAFLLGLASMAFAPAVNAGGQEFDVRIVIKGPEVRRCVRHDQDVFAPAVTRVATKGRAAVIASSPEFFDGRLWVNEQVPAAVSWGSFQCGVAIARQGGGTVGIDLDLVGVAGEHTKGRAPLHLGESKTFALGTYVVSAEVRRARPVIVPASFHRILDRVAAGQPFL